MASSVGVVNPVGIIGGGAAGLRCALELERGGYPYIIFDRNDVIGGKIQTDTVNSYLLDKGFQILLSNYPAWQELFPNDPLRCESFRCGAYIRTGGTFQQLFDPRREPVRSLSTLLSPICTWQDKLLLGRTLFDALKILNGEQSDSTWATISAREYLEQRGFSSAIVKSFFAPFFGGVFLDPSLGTKASIFLSVFARFATGRALLPAGGMKAIPEALFSLLRTPELRLGHVVVEASRDKVVLSNGEYIPVSGVVVAGAEQDAELFGTRLMPYRSVTCTYLAVQNPPAPLLDQTLILNGDNEPFAGGDFDTGISTTRGKIDHLAPLSSVQPTYARSGSHLVAAVTLHESSASSPDEEAIARELHSWFTPAKFDVSVIKQYRIDNALPSQTPADKLLPSTIAEGILRCGDHVGGGSLQGVLASGKQAGKLAMGWIRG